ncbi:probable RNA-binding protein 19 [Leptopilina heterotoma]|uniref:probable RNA-binding protein 19 n=1 Tax=Leptopilina heterotoma TaxID=63436 RepID=UPI001CA9702E|nr:probable RNA-binding protein 19 [Leptopilina heterotoma]
MSRLIVKNLPKSVTEDKLKEHFTKKGNITDVQLKYTKEGVFRRFCFIGYKTEEEAQNAVDYFNQTYIDTSKISVELCAKLGDSLKPKSWSKYAIDSSAHEKITGKTIKTEEESPVKKEKEKKKKEINREIKEIIEKHKDDPLFNEFLESHAGKTAQQVWSNEAQKLIKEECEDDESDSETEKVDTKQIEDKETEKKLDFEVFGALKKEKEPKKQVVKFFTVKIRGLGFNHKKKDLKQFFKPLKPKSIRVPQKIKGIAYVGFKTEKHMKQALSKHKSFLDGKQIFVAKYEQNDNQTDNEDKSKDIKWKKQAEALADEETIAESGRMFLRNLAYTTTEDDVTKLFEKYGPLTEVNLPVDRITRKPKGFGTVTFMMPEHAVKAYTELDGSILNGRMLHILPGKSKITAEDLLQNENLSYKDKKALKEKATAGSSHNWNTLFLGTDAVAEAMAATYNTTKEKILEDESKGISTAVRLALGETQIVEMTKKFLEENGVCIDAFNQPPTKRSKTVILVKNLPGKTSQNEILEMFSKHGEVGRVILPPAGITAIVEFFEPSEARIAFTRLAYTKFKSLPLYLEWAPDNSFANDLKKLDSSSNAAKQNKSKEDDKKQVQNEIGNAKEEKKNNDDDEDEDDDEPEPDTTLFVKNLNFSTIDEDLKNHFKRCGPLHYATVATKKDPKNPSAKLSMGYGFVRYKYKVHAERALKELQMTDLDGKTIELKRSERTLQSDLQVTKKNANITQQTGTKILVRNIPFQANANEVTQLFKVFGDLKAVRLPKKLVGDEKHRGFAFVEYSTKKDAKAAFKALCQSTHLYGRRLVLEWAQKEEAIDDIRKRTARSFHEEKSSKRSRKAVVDVEAMGLEEKHEEEEGE